MHTQDSDLKPRSTSNTNLHEGTIDSAGDDTDVDSSTGPGGEVALPRATADPSAQASVSSASDVENVTSNAGPNEPDSTASVHGLSDAESKTSHADSIFSVESYASSASSVAVFIIPDAVLRQIVDALFCTSTLDLLHAAALEDTAIGRERYMKNPRRLIKQYGFSIRSRAGVSAVKAAGRVLSSTAFAARAACEIVDRLGFSDERSDRTPRKDTERMAEEDDVESEDQHSDSDGDIGGSDLPEQQLHATTLALLQDTPEQVHFKARLLKFVHAPYENRISRALRSSSGGSVDRSASDAFDRYATELSWVPPHLVTFRERDENPILTRAGAFFASACAGWWTWRPLAERTSGVFPGRIHVMWRTKPCGNQRIIDLPSKYAQRLELALRTAPAFINAAIDKGSAHTCVHGSGAGLTPTAAHSGASIPSPSPNSAGGGFSQSPGSAPSSPQVASQPAKSARPAQCDPLHLYLCVRSGDRYRFSHVKILKDHTDVGVFSSLKTEYLKARSGLLGWLSWWRYSHCDFYLLTKYAQSGVPHEEGFPHPGDIDYENYDFQPRPVKPVPPIGPAEFADRFYTCCPNCVHWWHQEQRRRWGLSLNDRDAVALLPKRKMALEMEDGKRRYFWGLYVRELRSPAMIQIYVCLANAPGVVFFFLWIFQWDHRSLSDAIVPLTVSFTGTLGILACMYGRPDVR